MNLIDFNPIILQGAVIVFFYAADKADFKFFIKEI